MADEVPERRAGLKTVLVFLMLFAVLGAVVVFAVLTTFNRPLTTVILVRHAEKIIDPKNPDVDLSPAGEARAQELARMFAGTGISALYATQFKRTQQTVQPLADQLKLPVHLIDAKQTTELVKQLLTDHRGQTILVAGHNNTVPEIIAALGGPTLPVIPETEFDNIYIVTVYRWGRAKVVQLKYTAPVTMGGTKPTAVWNSSIMKNGELVATAGHSEYLDGAYIEFTSEYFSSVDAARHELSSFKGEVHPAGELGLKGSYDSVKIVNGARPRLAWACDKTLYYVEGKTSEAVVKALNNNPYGSCP